MTPDTVIAVTFSIDHLEVRTKILTRIAIGIIVRINVGQPKKLFIQFVIAYTFILKDCHFCKQSS